MRKLIVLFLVVNCLCTYSQNNDEPVIKQEVAISLKLISETMQFLDLYSDSIWGSWDAYSDNSIYIGGEEYFDLILNPTMDKLSGFSEIENSFIDNKILYRDSSHVENTWATVGVKIDSVYYRSIVRMPPYSFKLCSKSYEYTVSNVLNDIVVPDSLEHMLFSYENYIRLFIHESFHLYQKQNKRCPIWMKEVDFRNKKQAALSFIEGQLLLKAINEKDDEKFRDYINQFISVRDKRFKRLSFITINDEKHSEWLEGCAVYVECKALKLLNEDSAYCVPKGWFEFYKMTLDIDSRQFDNCDGKEYSYGWAIALILERLCGNVWQTEILSEGVYFEDLLKKHLPYEKKNSNVYFKNAKSTFRYCELIDTVKSLKKTKSYYISDY